jgi:hypothetical protein
MRICIRTRVMRLMSDRAYAYANGRLYIYGTLALEIDQSSQLTSLRSIQSNNKCCNSEGENRMNRLRYREKREGERRELYMRSVPLTTSPTSG